MNMPAGHAPAPQRQARPATKWIEEEELERRLILERILRGQGWLRSPVYDQAARDRQKRDRQKAQAARAGAT